MHKSLLLCFIHGFKGGDDTFGGFPEHLRALVSHALPNISVVAVTYPKFETRGDLNECVARFREWLQNVVIDLEVSASTPSPTIDPSVRTVLIGHSMGGIVAAETLLSITSDDPVPPVASTTRKDSQSSSQELNRDPSPSTHPFMFPYIQGILAFDTPYLGIAPSVIAHGAETHYKTATTAYSTLSEIASVFGYGANDATSPKRQQIPPKALPPGPESAKEAMAASMTAGDTDAAAVPAWQRWGKYAMFAGAAGAVAAGGAAAYVNRDTITEGWSWVGSHLEFVGCLMRGEELKERVEKVSLMRQERSIGFRNLVTVLGKGAIGTKGALAEAGSLGQKRMFCVVPAKGKGKIRGGGDWWEASVNEKARDETVAHMSMFYPKDNPGYFVMAERAKEVLAGWVDQGWYAGSEGREQAMGVEDEVLEAGLGEEEPVMVN